MSIRTTPPDSELESEFSDHLPLASEQRRELMAAQAIDFDLDFAFNLQLQEAITASLSVDPQPSISSAAICQPGPSTYSAAICQPGPSTSSAAICQPGPSTSSAAICQPGPSTSSAAVSQSHPDEQASSVTNILSDELLKLEEELKDQAVSESEFKKLKNDLHRRIHDQRMALEISTMSEDEWEDWGNEFERPFGEGSSEGVNDETFRLYFKGLVEKQLPDGVFLGGIGIAICDSRDELLFELRKPLVGDRIGKHTAELRALIEGLSAALELDLKRVTFYCDYYPIFRYVMGHWSAKQRKVSALVNQVSQIREKFTHCQPSLIARNDVKFAFKLAREAIDSHLSKAAASSSSKKETCAICLEDTDLSQIFSIDTCMHRYCFSCMKQHVEVKMLHGVLPTCPHEDCKSELKIDSCSKFLTPRLIEIMSQRIKEASIPVTEKIYCPYPKCSALMSKREVLEYSKSALVGAERFGARKCIKCNGRFCVDCKVPWHNNMTCSEYKSRYRCTPFSETRLKSLAAKNLWRQCVKCNHMIELAAGCYHMTCRCGYEFCYTCGAEWKDKKATCSCPLWDEGYIIEDEFDDDEDEDEDGDEEDYDSDSDEHW